MCSVHHRERREVEKEGLFQRRWLPLSHVQVHICRVQQTTVFFFFFSMVGGADSEQIPSAARWLNHSGGKPSGANRCLWTLLVTLRRHSSASEWSCRFLGRVLIWLTGSWQCPFGWAAKRLRRLFAEGEKLWVRKDTLSWSLQDHSAVITSVLNVAACSLHPGSPLTKLATLWEEEERSDETSLFGYQSDHSFVLRKPVLLIPEWPACVCVRVCACASWLRTVWLCKHVWPPPHSKQPPSWQSAPGPQGAAGSVCPSRGPPGVGETRRCQERTRTREGPVGGRWFLERLGREVIFQFHWNTDGHVFIGFPFRVKHTFTVSDLLFNIVHFQVFGSRSCSERQLKKKIFIFNQFTKTVIQSSPAVTFEGSTVLALFHFGSAR